MVYVSYIVETEAVNANNKKVYAVSSNVAVRGDSSPCSRGLWYNQSFWYNIMVYVSYTVETEAVNANNNKKYMP